MTLKVCISTDLQGTFYAWNTIVFKCELYKSYTKDYQGLKNVIISSKFLPLFKYASMMVSTSILRFCFYKSSSFSASLSYRSCSFDISDFTLDISFSIASYCLLPRHPPVLPCLCMTDCCSTACHIPRHSF